MTTTRQPGEVVRHDELPGLVGAKVRYMGQLCEVVPETKCGCRLKTCEVLRGDQSTITLVSPPAAPATAESGVADGESDFILAMLAPLFEDYSVHLHDRQEGPDRWYMNVYHDGTGYETSETWYGATLL